MCLRAAFCMCEHTFVSLLVCVCTFMSLCKFVHECMHKFVSNLGQECIGSKKKRIVVLCQWILFSVRRDLCLRV